MINVTYVVNQDTQNSFSQLPARKIEYFQKQSEVIGFRSIFENRVLNRCRRCEALGCYSGHFQDHE